jgi:hypothetical protein
VLDTDPQKNLLTIETRDGEQVSYNPNHLKQQTKESIVYREEDREIAVGERIKFTAPDRESHIRAGDLATVERIGEDNTLSVRMDNGKSIELDADKARHIDYGYTVETAKGVSADRILLTGESGQLAQQQASLSRLNSNVHDFAIYTSDNTNLLQRDNLIGKEPELSQEGLSNDPSFTNAPESSGHSIEIEGHGIGL